jgi:hypothetical protein
MQLTKSRLKLIIKEELANLLREAAAGEGSSSWIEISLEENEKDRDYNTSVGRRTWYVWATTVDLSTGEELRREKIGELVDRAGVHAGDRDNPDDMEPQKSFEARQAAYGVNRFGGFTTDGDLLVNAATTTEVVDEFQKWYKSRYDELDQVKNKLLFNHNFNILDNEYGFPVAKKITLNLPLLQQYKITKRLKAGGFGTAFLLDNDHVLKIFQSGLEGVEEELATYKNFQDKQFMGTAEINEPAVYDFGIIPNTEYWNNYYFAEIGKVITLTQWYEMTGRSAFIPKLWALVPFKDELTNLSWNYSRQTSTSNPQFKESLLDLFQEFGKRFQNSAKMTKEEVNAYFRAVLNLIREYGLGRAYDVHHQNTGVNIQNPSEFVIFDF